MKTVLDLEYTELDHFKGKDKVVAAIYAWLIDELRKFGPLKIEPKKTSIP
jgi:hypothetical protein